MMLIKNARLIDPSQKYDGVADILIEKGRIKSIGEPGEFHSQSVTETIDATGLLLTPGFIDVHVHLREPGFEYKETLASGARAAILGGFTSVAVMANTDPVNDQAMITQMILEKGRAANQARVFVIGAVSKGLKGQELSQIGMMAEAGIVALSDDGMPVMNSGLMRRAMEYASMFDLAIISHAEDLALSQGTSMTEGAVSSLLGYTGNPNASEEIMVAREIALARATGARVHIAHLSTKEGVEQVRLAKTQGLRVTAEVTPHHLMMNELTLLNGSHACVHHQMKADYKMAPPLRSVKDQEALIEALNSGVIDIIASDHAPHGCVDKEVEFELAANGILGLQTTTSLMLELVHAKKLSLDRMVDALTAKPAALLKLKDLGTLRPGAYADLNLIDLNLEWTLQPNDLASLSKNTPFLGRKFKGKVVKTMVEGIWK